MKKKKMLCIMLLAFSTAIMARAEAPMDLLIHRNTGGVENYLLSSLQKLEFDSPDLLLYRNGEAFQEIRLFTVQKLTFAESSGNKLNDNPLSDLRIYTYEGQLVIKSDQAISHLRVVSLTGQVIYADQNLEAQQYIRIATSHWSHGMYVVLAETANGRNSQKVLIQ